MLSQSESSLACPSSPDIRLTESITVTEPSFLIDLSFLYTRLVATFSGVRSTADVSEILVDLTGDNDAEPRSERSKLLLPEAGKGGPLSPSVREFMAMCVSSSYSHSPIHCYID